MRRAASVWALCLAACGPAPEARVEPPSGPTAPPSTSTSVDVPAPIPTRPSSQALTFAARPEALRAWLAFLLEPRDLGGLEKELGLDAGALGSQAGLAALGIDPAGTLFVEGLELDARAAAEAERLAALDRAAPDDELAGALGLETRRTEEGFAMLRVRVPVKSAATARGALVRILERKRASRWQSPSDDVTVLGLTGQLWTLRDAPGELLVGVALGRKDMGGGGARAALAALAAWAPTSTPSLGEADATLAIRPAAVGPAGLWLGFLLAAEATDGEAVEPDFVRRILVEGFREATQATRLDAPDGKPRYAEVRLSARGHDLTARAVLAPGTPDVELPKSVATPVVAGADASLEVAGPAAYAWPLLPATPGVNPYRGHAANDAIHEAGAAGMLVIAGDAPFVAARIALETAEELGQPTKAFMRRFERLGVAHVERSIVYVGLVADGADEEHVACALSRTGERCGKDERIPDKGITTVRGYSVARRRIDGRWLILASRERKAIGAAKVSLSQGPAPLVRAALDLKEILGRADLGSFRFDVDLSSDRRSFEAKCHVGR